MSIEGLKIWNEWDFGREQSIAGTEGIIEYVETIQKDNRLTGIWPSIGLFNEKFKFGEIECRPLAELVRTHPSLSRFRIWAYPGILPRALDLLIEAVSANVRLRELDLSSNRLGIQGGLAVARMMETKRHVEKLSVRANGFTTRVAVAFANVLKVNGNLRVLDLGENDFEDLTSIEEALQQNKTLETLYMGQEAGGKIRINILPLLKALRSNKGVTEFHCTCCNFDTRRIQALSDVLRHNCKLKRLDLSHTRLGELREFDSCVNNLQYNHSLQVLNLSCCSLSTQNAVTLATILKTSNFTIFYLNLHWNDDIGTGGVLEFISVIEMNPTLKMLYLGQTRAKDKGAEAFAHALKTNTTLLSLGFDTNGLTDKGAEAFLEALESNTTLQELHLYQQSIDDGILKKIKGALEVNKKLAKLKSKKECASRIPNTAHRSTEKSELASLDNATAQKLQKLSDKSAEILEAAEKLQVIDVAALQALQGQALQLKRLFDGDAKAEHANAERKRIEADPDLATYHRFFARLLTGTWLACQTINSGLVENTEKFTSDRVGQGLDAIGKHIPIISAVTSFFSGAISKWNDRERHQGVQKIAALFPDLDTAFRDLGTLARQATLAQESALKQLPAQATRFIGRLKQRAQDLKAAILADDVDTPLKRKAVTDCQTLLTAIRDGRPCSNPSVADLLTVLMGNGYVYTASPPPSSPPPLLSPTPSPQTPSSPSMTMEQMIALVQQQAAEMKRLQERDEARDREFKAWKQHRMSSQDNETEVPGDSEAQAQIKTSRALNRNDAAYHSAPVFGAVARLESQVTRLTHQVTVVEARQQETEDTVAVTNARVDRLAKKKTSKT